MKIRIVIEYDGESFCGWQRQSGQLTVQSALEDALSKVFNTKDRVIVEGAGRTDAGVHAIGQVAHFEAPDSWHNRVDKLPMAINFYLISSGILGAVVLSAEKVSENFHARFSATMRHYRYLIYNRKIKSVLSANRAWHVPQKLNVHAMREASKMLIGKHDFTAFRSTSCQAKNPVRTLTDIDVRQKDDYIVVDVSARSFLHNQVRIMVGTLVQVGLGKYSQNSIKEMLQSCDRTKSGPTAPPHGLYFTRVDYRENS